MCSSILLVSRSLCGNRGKVVFVRRNYYMIGNYPSCVCVRFYEKFVQMCFVVSSHYRKPASSKRLDMHSIIIIYC